jgi:5'-nucleotidase
VDGQQVTTVSLSGGEASASIGPFPRAGTRYVEVRYLGDDLTEPGTATTTVTVTNGNP